jgi:hypothetical protein
MDASVKAALGLVVCATLTAAPTTVRAQTSGASTPSSPSAPPPEERTTFGFTEWRVRSLAPLSHDVAGIGTNLLFSLGVGVWRDWFRASAAVGTGFWGDCSPCSPFSNGGAYEIEGRVAAKLWSDRGWEIWAEAGYGWIGARGNGKSEHVHAAEAMGSVWRRLTHRRNLVDVAVSFDAQLEAWIGPDDVAPAVGLGVGIVAPF